MVSSSPSIPKEFRPMKVERAQRGDVEENMITHHHYTDLSTCFMARYEPKERDSVILCTSKAIKTLDEIPLIFCE